MHQFRILSQNGDDRHEWDPSDSGSVAVAERIFNEKVTVKQGAAFATYPALNSVETPVREGPASGAQVGETRRIKQFDPLAEEILIIPQMQGG